MSLSFRQFMQQRIRPKSPISQFRNHDPANREDGLSQMSRDFIGDALSDKTFPTIKTFDQLYDYLTGVECRACDGAIEGGLDTFADWTLYRIREGTFTTASERAFTLELRRKGRGWDKQRLAAAEAAEIEALM